jgi:phosphoesterase RecJ-like protein
LRNFYVKSDLLKVIGAINGAPTIGLMTHVHGDGDAFGSLLALRDILESLGKKVIIFSNEALPKYLEYRREEARYNPIGSYRAVDLFIGVDVAGKKRFTIPEIFDTAKEKGVKTLIIDHHAEGDIYPFVDFAWQKTDISSTAEMIYWLAVELGVKFDKTLAEFLLWGIETDTYFLSNKNVFATTKKARASLLNYGASTEDIKANTKAVSPTSNTDFMLAVHDRMIENKAEKLIFTYVTVEDRERFGFETPVSSAVASNLEYEYHPRVSTVIEQATPKVIKVSMRSNHSEVDVAKIAASYHGGGHLRAAGFEMEGDAERDFERIVDEITAKIVDTDSK